jgi:hypothetical protein
LRHAVTTHPIFPPFDGRRHDPVLQVRLRAGHPERRSRREGEADRMADAPQNSVTRDDLRDALAAHGPLRRPTGLFSRPEESDESQESHEPVRDRDREHGVPREPEPAWDWDASPNAADALELDELRGVTAEQRRHIDELVTAQEAAAETERQLREALSELAAAGALRRRAVVAGLRARGLL